VAQRRTVIQTGNLICEDAVHLPHLNQPGLAFCSSRTVGHPAVVEIRDLQGLPSCKHTD
jgi:hypothetical protein